jgi:hypothetical protein
MLQYYHILETSITLYVFLNWFFCLVTLSFMAFIFFSKRYLFIKPSILLLTYSHIFFQWPLAIYSGYYEKFLPDPFAFAFLIHAYTLIGLLVSVFILNRKARMIWEQVTNRETRGVQVSLGAVLILGVLTVGVTVFYLRNVPFSQTGLYAIFFRPEVSALWRERSLKLLEIQTLKYAYSIMVSSIAPLLVVMLFFAFLNGFKRLQMIAALFSLAAIVGIIFVISLPGARVSAVNMLLAITFAYLFHRGLPFRPLKFFLIITVILLLPALLSILREGREISFGTLVTYLDYVGHRTFLLTMDVGSWYVHHSQVEGSFGTAAIPKLAALLGIDVINVPNLIGFRYSEHPLASVSAVAGYLFTYYSYFGISSLMFSLMGLWFLDVAIIIYGKLSHALLLPCIAAISVSTLSFISSDYTTVWITHGFGIILFLSWVTDRLRSRINKLKPVILFPSANTTNDVVSCGKRGDFQKGLDPR